MPGALRADAATPGWEEPGAVARRDLAERRSGTGIAAVERGRIHGGAGPVGALGAALQDRSVIAQLHGVLAADAWEPLRQRSQADWKKSRSIIRRAQVHDRGVSLTQLALPQDAMQRRGDAASAPPTQP